jgi:hypothetical protein
MEAAGLVGNFAVFFDLADEMITDGEMHRSRVPGHWREWEAGR